MRIAYVCRHCHHLVGEVNRPDWTYNDAVRYSGVAQLSAFEQSETVAYSEERHTMFVQTICDYCENALEAHPELLVEGKLLQ